MSAHEQLRSDLMRAVAATAAPEAARPKRRSVRRATRVLILIGALVVAGGAVALSTRLAQHAIVVPTHIGRRPAVVLAQSGRHGVPWRLFLRPCGAGEFATGIMTGPPSAPTGAGVNSCERRDPAALLSDATFLWTPGLTVIDGLTGTDVSTVRITLQRHRRMPSGRDRVWPDGIATTRTRLAPTLPFGHRIAPMRFFVLSRPYRVEFAKIEALNSRGEVVAVCARPGCSTTRSLAPAAPPKQP